MIQFDTRDKKPKVYNILVLLLIAAAIITVLVLFGGEQKSLGISITALVFFVLVLASLLIAFVRQVQYNPYSYNTIYYIGFALFLVSIIVQYVILVVQVAGAPEPYPARNLLASLQGSGRLYMFLSFPFILLFSIALCISNISLLRHEGFRPVNVLGIILAFLFIGSFAALWKFDFYVSGSENEVMVHDLVSNVFSSVYLYVESMLLGTMVAGAMTARYEPAKDKDFLIILGCGIRKDGTPTPLLRGRIDRAIGFYKKQKAETGKELTFITSGGQGSDEVISESACMKQYLLSQGIPEERIIEENRSTSTMENMKFSKEILQNIDPEGKIAFSTTNYHVFRSGLLSRRVKMRAVGMGAKTRWYFWPNAAVREFVGLLTEHRGKQAAFFCGMLLFYVILTICTYKI